MYFETARMSSESDVDIEFGTRAFKTNETARMSSESDVDIEFGTRAFKTKGILSSTKGIPHHGIVLMFLTIILIFVILEFSSLQENTPWGRRGRIRPQHPLACRKRRLNGAACLPWAATRVA